MSYQASAISTQAFEDTGVIVMARINGNLGTAITQASLSEIAYSTYDTNAEAAVSGASGTLTISSVVSDTLITNDVRWTKDTTGYNFIDTIPATALPDGGVTYAREYKFTPATGQPFHLQVLIETKNLWRS